MKRALLVGINYVGTKNELRGCINDIDNVAAHLQSARGYPSNSFIVMSDVSTRKPTRANILSAFKELLQGVRSGDELWFHYSGHGALQRDTNGDEESGADSCICPLDFNQSGFITDDVIRSALAALVPAGARLYVILDSCHSGTGCDLRYKHDDSSYLIAAAAPLPAAYDPNAWALRQTSYEYKRHAKTGGEVFCISGCQDSQTSADAYLAGKPSGALTHCLLQALKANDPATYKWKHLLKDVCCGERIGQFTQRTSITSGTPLNLENRVFLAPATTGITVAPATNATTAITVAPATNATTVAPATNVVSTPVKPLPQWVQAYLYQLQRMRLPVPIWLRVYISQLQRGLQMQQGSRNHNPNPSNKMKMGLVRY
jgi:hypothetical protein